MDLTEIYRRFLRNAGVVIGGRVVFGLINLATNAIVIRTYGLSDLGVVLLLQAYVRIFAEIVRFQSWKAILRYGAVIEEEGDKTALKRLFGFVLMVDIVSMGLAVVVAVLMVPWAASWFHWIGPVADFAPFFVISLIFITHATPTGILRLFDMFDTLAIQHALNAVIRFVLVGLAILFGGPVLWLVLAWFCASVLSGLYSMVVCARALKERDLLPDIRVNWLQANEEFKGIWRFMWLSNISSGPTLLVRYGMPLFVGQQLGAAAAAAYEVARQFGNSISRPAKLLGPLLFPDFAKLAARDDWVSMRKVMRHQLLATSAVMIGVALVLFTALPLVIRLVFGPELMEHLWLFRLLILGSMIGLVGFALQPAFLASDKAGTYLIIQVIATVAFITGAAIGMQIWGLNGSGLGLLCSMSTQLLLAYFIGRRLLKKRIRKSKNKKNEVPIVDPEDTL